MTPYDAQHILGLYLQKYNSAYALQSKDTNATTWNWITCCYTTPNSYASSEIRSEFPEAPFIYPSIEMAKMYGKNCPDETIRIVKLSKYSLNFAIHSVILIVNK